ncbi:MAG: hypothetical protein IJU95_04830 [Treponema sp.]|nr:hypothetical protein [Treponema sp.]
MAKTVLVAGKEMPSGSKFADGLALSGRSISITTPELSQEEEEAAAAEKSMAITEASGISLVEWHKASPISSRTLIFSTEAAFGHMDEAVLFFDAEWLASLERPLSSAECIRGCDELVLPFQCLALEVLSRFEKKNSTGVPGMLVFLFKETPDQVDILKAPALRSGGSSISSPVVAAAAAAFEIFAENIAVQFGNKSYVNILLTRSGIDNELSSSDMELGKWLAEYMDSFKATGAKFDAKTSGEWVKAGSRYGAGGFKLFGKKR